MPGNINAAGSHPGSVGTQVVIVPAFGPIPDNQQGEITDFNFETEDPSTNSVAIIQISNDGFNANIVEKDRLSIPGVDSYTRTYGAESGNGRLIIPQGYECRVVGYQVAGGAFSASLFGQTRWLDSTHGGRQTDALGTDFIDL